VILKKGLPLSNRRAYTDYFNFVRTGNEEPLTTHADRFSSSLGYGMSSYDKGSIFLSQLGYVIGEKTLSEVLKKYYSDYVFSHPNPEDFIRVAEKVSGQELDWYLMDWGQTTKTIDYAVNDFVKSKSINCDSITVHMSRKGEMAIPNDVEVEFVSGLVKQYHIPLLMSRGHKPLDSSVTLLEPWSWAKKNYSFDICVDGDDVVGVTVDPLNKSADTDQSNNSI
jgi:hypothetical protein